MSVHDLVWKTTVGMATIYDPAEVSTVAVSFTLQNLGTEDLTNIGLYIKPSSTLGDVDNLYENTPETDYQDILTWGTETDEGITLTGGMILEVPVNGGGTATYYVTRTQGSSVGNKIPFADILSNATAVFEATLELPPGAPARRFYVDLVME